MQTSPDGVLGDVNVGSRPEVASKGPGSDVSVTQRHQLKVTVVMMVCCSGASGTGPYISTSGGLEAFMQALNNGVAHSKSSGDFSAGISILKPAQRPSTIKC